MSRRQVVSWLSNHQPPPSYFVAAAAPSTDRGHLGSHQVDICHSSCSHSTVCGVRSTEILHIIIIITIISCAGIIDEYSTACHSRRDCNRQCMHQRPHPRSTDYHHAHHPTPLLTSSACLIMMSQGVSHSEISRYGNVMDAPPCGISHSPFYPVFHVLVVEDSVAWFPLWVG